MTTLLLTLLGLLIVTGGVFLVARWGFLLGGCLMGGWNIISTGLEITVKALTGSTE